MQREEFINRITEIGANEDIAIIRQQLTELSDVVAADYQQHETTQQQNATLQQDNETLRAANMKLFLQVGESKTKEEQIKDQTGIDTQKPVKREFKNLFNDKGELK